MLPKDQDINKNISRGVNGSEKPPGAERMVAVSESFIINILKDLEGIKRRLQPIIKE